MDQFNAAAAPTHAATAAPVAAPTAAAFAAAGPVAAAAPTHAATAAPVHVAAPAAAAAFAAPGPVAAAAPTHAATAAPVAAAASMANSTLPRWMQIPHALNPVFYFIPWCLSLSGVAPAGYFSATGNADLDFINDPQFVASGKSTFFVCVQLLACAMQNRTAQIYQAELRSALENILVSASAFFKVQRSKLKDCYNAKRKLTMVSRESTGWSRYSRGAYSPAQAAFKERQRLSNVQRCNTLAIKSRVKELERHIKAILCAEAQVTNMEIMHTVYLLSNLCYLGSNILIK